MTTIDLAPRGPRGRPLPWHVLSLLLVVTLFRGVPRWVLGEDSYVLIHDNLDSDFLYRVLISRPGRLLDYDSTIPEMMGGLPRWTFPSGSKLSSLVFSCFPPFSAYVIQEQIVSALAAAGMWLLLRDYVPAPRWCTWIIALSFALLPFYVIYDLTVAGQAFVLWALLNAWNGKKPFVSWLVCAAFPFLSILQMAGTFVVAEATLGVTVAALWYHRSRPLSKALWPFFCACTLGLGYLVADFGFLSHYLLDDFVSHRGAWVPPSSPVFDFAGVTKLLLHSRYHAASQHEPILALAMVGIVIAYWRGRRLAARRLALLLALAVLIAVSYCYQTLPGFSALSRAFPILGQITPRFWWSFPVLWFLIWGFTAASWPRSRLGTLSLLLFAALQFGHGTFNPSGSWSRDGEMSHNYALLAARLSGDTAPRSFPTYREFRSKRAVQAIRRYVGDRPGRYLCIGFHPSVLQLAGLPTADGYRDLYPLSYKARFRALIRKELARDGAAAAYFDRYGSRAYYFYAGIDRNRFSRKPFVQPISREILMDRDAAVDLDVRWVVSAFKIEGKASRFLTFHKTFRQKGGFTFYLYSLD